MRSREKLEALVENAYQNGQKLDSFGDYNEGTQEGHDAGFFQYGGLYLVVERNDDDVQIDDYIDAQEARLDFEEIKEEIEAEIEDD